ncbi:MAG: dihydrolipoyl dehydrogenase [Marinilabiliales bacterium]|nr:MAG: dihydrolipoyl dehydrogenase [Marinilabiliales bacterium]
MKYDVIIIGSGPAGYIAAVRAGQIGLKTAIIEKKDIGGMCLNWGCVPIKSLIESAKFYNKIKKAHDFGIKGIDPKVLEFDWLESQKRASGIVKKLTKGIEKLLKKNKVAIIKGEAKITSKNSVTVNNRNLEADKIIIATGSKPAPLKHQFNKKFIIELEELNKLKEIPKKLAVYGHGPVAIEIAQLFRLIDKDVTLFYEADDLVPGLDKFLTSYIISSMEKQGIQVIKTNSIKPGTKNNSIDVNKKTFKFDKLINCSWRNAVIPDSKKEIKTEKGFIKTNLFLQTNIPSIYAIGDVNGESFLAHSASAQGFFAINHSEGIKGEIQLHNYPMNIYSNPEVAQIGKTEQQLKDLEIDYMVTSYPLSLNSKALAEGNEEGFIRILSEKKLGEVLGVQIVSHNATDMIAEATAFMSVEATVYDVAKTVHAHPTISEVFMEAGHDAIGQALHK